jgi:hypothetical protein
MCYNIIVHMLALQCKTKIASELIPTGSTKHSTVNNFFIFRKLEVNCRFCKVNLNKTI